MSALAEVTTVDVAAAAGALNSNGLEIARWLELQLNAGLDAKTNTRLFSEAQSREMWTPQTLLPSAPAPQRLELAKTHFRAYALGWGLSDYRGQRSCHTGAVCRAWLRCSCSFQSDTLRSRCSRMRRSPVRFRRCRTGCSIITGLKSPDWITAVNETFKERLAKAQEQLAASKEKGKDEQGKGYRRYPSRNMSAAIAMRGTAP